MQRCMGCMKEFGLEYDVCPHCGYIVGTKPEIKMHLKSGTVLSSRYILGKVLGYGGFGVTYIAWDNRLNRPVAVKEFFPHALSTRSEGTLKVSCYDKKSEEFFQNGKKKMIDEGNTLSGFSSNENIVNIFDCFEENNTAYIVMEYLEGKDIKAYLHEKGGKLTVKEAIGIILPVLNALEDMHKVKLIHRDISPDNIFLCSNGKIKLLDFGSARIAVQNAEKSLSVIIKPGFAPKEQYLSRSNQGPWTDVYATCATLYKLITGITPPDSTAREDQEIKTFAELGISSYDALEKVILKGMATEIADRIKSVDELRTELNNAINSNKQPATASATSKKMQPVNAPAGSTQKRKTGIIVAVILLAVVAAVIFAFKPWDSKDDVEQSNTSSASSTLGEALADITQAPDTTQPSTTAVDETQWKTAYIDLLTNHFNYVDTPGCFSIDYVDDDEIPELFIADWANHPDEVSVYTYHNGATALVCKDGEFGGVQYIRKEGYICGRHGDGFAINYTVYKLSNGTVEQIFRATDERSARDLGYSNCQVSINGSDVSDQEMDEFSAKYFGEGNSFACFESDNHYEPTEENYEKYIMNF